MKCYYCGLGIAENSRFCTHCGRPVQRMNTPSFETLTFNANLYKNVNLSEGGKLYIESEFVIFKPNLLNFNLFTPEQRTIAIKDIIGYKKGWLTNMDIYVAGREPYKVQVFNKDKLINILEERRFAYYNSRGLQIPPLAK